MQMFSTVVGHLHHTFVQLTPLDNLGKNIPNSSFFSSIWLRYSIRNLFLLELLVAKRYSDPMLMTKASLAVDRKIVGLLFLSRFWNFLN